MRMQGVAAIPVLILSMLVAGCDPGWWVGGPVDDPKPVTEIVPFETLARGEYGGVEQAGERIISNDADWRILWAEVYSTQMPVPEMPQVDFSQYMVIAVFQGTQGTGGHGITVKSMGDDGTRLHVGIDKRVPTGGCIVTEALTQPYHIVMTARSSFPVAFDYTTQRACN